VEKAKDLADQMVYAWVAANQSIPYGYMNFTDHKPTIATVSGSPTFNS